MSLPLSFGLSATCTHCTQILPGNKYSFQQIYEANITSDPAAIEAQTKALHRKTSSSIFALPVASPVLDLTTEAGAPNTDLDV